MARGDKAGDAKRRGRIGETEEFALNEVDVLVAGGGPSGLIAATAAGRLGAKTH